MAQPKIDHSRHGMGRWVPWLGVAVLAMACVGVSLPTNTAAGQAGALWQERAGKSAVIPRDYSPLPSIAGLVKELKPAVVNVYTTQVIKPGKMFKRQQRFRQGPFDDFGGRNPFEFFFNQPQQEMRRTSLGSGFIISPDGYVITNHHVVDNASEIKVRLADEREFPAKLVGSDQKTDVALLKVDAKKKLPFVYLGDSDKLEVGEWVIAIGNPFGLGHTVTAGILSGKDRVIGHGPYDDFLQTDASINPGNSGGPLFDSTGNVVGINTAIIAGGSGVGFAVPINLAKGLLPQLHTKGKVTRGWLGVGIQDLSPDLAKGFGVKARQGVLVAQVFTDGPADKAGLKSGDIILQLNGKPMTSMRELTTAIAALAPDSSARVLVLRDGKQKDMTVMLGERQRGESLALGQGEAPEGQADLGLSLAPLSPERARRLGVDEDLRGLVIEQIEPDSPAVEVVQPGDVILEVNRRRVTSIAEFNAAVKAAGKKGDLLLHIQRGSSRLYLVIKN